MIEYQYINIVKITKEKGRQIKVKKIFSQIYALKGMILKMKNEKAITLIALVITILFSYDEKLKCSNSKGFLLQTI